MFSPVQFRSPPISGTADHFHSGRIPLPELRQNRDWLCFQGLAIRGNGGRHQTRLRDEKALEGRRWHPAAPSGKAGSGQRRWVRFVGAGRDRSGRRTDPRWTPICCAAPFPARDGPPSRTMTKTIHELSSSATAEDLGQVGGIYRRCPDRECRRGPPTRHVVVPRRWSRRTPREERGIHQENVRPKRRQSPLRHWSCLRTGAPRPAACRHAPGRGRRPATRSGRGRVRPPCAGPSSPRGRGVRGSRSSAPPPSVPGR